MNYINALSDKNCFISKGRWMLPLIIMQKRLENHEIYQQKATDTILNLWIAYLSCTADLTLLPSDMSVQFSQWYFVTKIVLTYCEKKLFFWFRKSFEIWGWRPRICKIVEITWTIYSNSERSEQFLLTEFFFNLFLEVSQI